MPNLPLPSRVDRGQEFRILARNKILGLPDRKLWGGRAIGKTCPKTAPAMPSHGFVPFPMAPLAEIVRYSNTRAGNLYAMRKSDVYASGHQYRRVNHRLFGKSSSLYTIKLFRLRRALSPARCELATPDTVVAFAVAFA